MDRYDEIALSKIAALLEKNTIVKTINNVTWERILSNAGQSMLFNINRESLTPYTYNGSYENDNLRFSNFYTAIKSVLRTVYHRNGNEFVILMGSIIEAINIQSILRDEFDNLIPRSKGYYDSLEEYFNSQSNDENLIFIREHSSVDFHNFVNNLHILNLDIAYSSEGLSLKPFTEQALSDSPRDTSLLLEWLARDYPDLAQTYEDAVKNYINGIPVSCISNCRNILTGIFTQFKDDGSKWVTGLRNLSTDVNIENIATPNNIMQGSANRNITFDTDRHFNYPRFKVIYNLYSLTSDLGPHSTEAPKIGGVVQPSETATLGDALLCLRMTEDVLIWVKDRL